MIRRAMLAACLLTGACAEPRDDKAFTAAHTPQWRKLSDGSSFATIDPGNGLNKLGIRCWPAGKDGFKCLRVGTMDSSAGELISVSVERQPKLPTHEIGITEPGDGYSCMYGFAYSEAIRRGGKDLMGHLVGFGDARWSRSFVAGYMQRNDVTGQAYYRCLDIIEAVNMGSLETLSTTSVTKAMVD